MHFKVIFCYHSQPVSVSVSCYSSVSLINMTLEPVIVCKYPAHIITYSQQKSAKDKNSAITIRRKATLEVTFNFIHFQKHLQPINQV